MSYDRRAASYRLMWILIGLMLALVLVLALRMRAVATPAAAGGLPTAQVLLASRPGGPVAGPVQRPLRFVPAPAAVATVPPAALPTASPTVPPAEPTLTITPIALADVAAPAAPVPTLFATQAPAPPASGQAELTPILMYHYIRWVDAAADPMGYNLSITPAEFEQQIAWLQQQGYHSVTMATAQGCVRGEGACPPRAIALTFDDGYEDAYTNALPILQRYGMVGTFYIVNSLVGQPGYMTWDQLAVLRDAGMELGAHSVSHLNLTTLDQATAAAEIGQSKTDLESRLGISVSSFCYPAGFYDATTEVLVQAAGYSNATTTRWDGDYSDMFALPRRRVAGGTSIDGFVGIVAGG
ncbi:MAG: polysaccharide deacetylase family protein [Kouleothrix sp.]|jgi:peptidoglycan/xylan/chitin deacetylase (PgdA/CDA1 family)|nr:polysaccharide deacetylase family protein [Kouleothrix sp.]